MAGPRYCLLRRTAFNLTFAIMEPRIEGISTTCPNGMYARDDVSLTIPARKEMVDTAGVETPLPMDDLVETESRGRS